MALSLYVVLDDPEPGFDVYVDGRAVASAVDALDSLCEQAGLPLLDGFVGEPSDEMDAAFAAEDDSEDDQAFDPDTDADTTARWLEASEGVAWIQAVADLIDEQPDALDDPDAVLQDLNDIQHVLELAQAARLRWHFAWDF